ncbi:copper fist DNA binding domain-containing protein [Glomus cerebriforme]|uniref:Copper fist DNA binding domain-containing protein n=1 Tax=Glomus cerebriforme TaxID=658196 RepID=A0A397S960_9GLOM|nr:copper fist DNA binding domain-containing protein [Glomus cerebriforme]
MVFIDGVKYACATCIKGHRSTSCLHNDRELFAIKRKGRPITQCSHCRELRRTQKVHVKCNCNEKKKEESILYQTQSVEGISADIQSQEADYQSFTGDKTSVEALLNPCQCLTGAKCICCRDVTDQDSSNTQYSNYNPSHFNKEVATPNTIMNIPSANNYVNNNDSSYLFSPISSVQTTMYKLPPISASLNHDNTFIPYNTREYSSINSSGLQKNTGPFTNNISLERRYSYNDKDDIEFKSRDQSKILGEEVCHSTSTDLANIIYGPFKSCPSAMADGSCCGSNKQTTTTMSVCRCGPGCKCEGCDTHARRVNVGNSYNDTISSSSNCCSSYHEVTQPERKKIRDEDGVLLCDCGCQKLDTECPDCLENLCEEYLFK